MKEISRVKRQEVAQHYLLGFSYEEIVRKTGVSHGSVANIIKEVENGSLAISGSAFDRISDLRQLSVDLRKKNLEPSQALLGLLLFERLRALGISPELVESWSELVKRFSVTDFPTEEFVRAALRLQTLEKEAGSRFEDLTEEYKKLQEGVEKLTKQIDGLNQNKLELSEEIVPLSRQSEEAKRQNEKLEGEIEVQKAKVQDLRSKVKEIKEDKSQLSRQVKGLKRREAKLSAQVDGREESLARINDIGLADEDLLRLRAFLEKMSEQEGISPEQVKERFFQALSLFRELSGLEKNTQTEAQKVKALTKEKSVLEGQIKGLEKAKSTLEGEIDIHASSVLEKIRGIGLQASQQIGQQVIDIRKQFSELFSEALKAGEAVGQMLAAVRKGEESQKSMEAFLEEARRRVEAR